ncbi:MAG: DNA-binding domain-containing protein [Paracoccaceae bacterium]
MSTSQALFRDALLNPDLPVPDGLVDAKGRPAGKRFSVYRNNVVVSLTEALEVGFPVLRKLVGDDFFRAMAGVYLRQQPPGSQQLTLYGSGMAAFLEGFEPVAHLGYLPDIARLEYALRIAYHAADATPVPAEALQALIPEGLIAARLRLAPAVQVLRSPWPVLSIWRANTETGAPAPSMQAEDVLITRPEYDPRPSLLPPGGADFIAALQRGNRLGVAHDAAMRHKGFDLSAVLGTLLSGGAITEILPED